MQREPEHQPPDSPGPASVPAEVVLGAGRASASALLVLRCLRGAARALILFGIAIAIAFDRFDQRTTEELSTSSGILNALLTPLGVLAVGVALRIALVPLAYMLALIVVVADQRDILPARDRRTRVSRIGDRWRRVGGYRTLRWTTAVKHEAVDRLGPQGRLLAATELAMYVLASIAVVAIVVAATFQ